MKRKQFSLIAGTAICLLIALLTAVYALPSYLSLQTEYISPCDLGVIPEDVVKAVTEAGLMQTETLNEAVYFYPEKPVTRAEFAKTLSLLLLLPIRKYNDTSLGFTDETAIRAEYLPYVRTVIANGYMKLYSDLTFRPDQEMTREETADIIGSLLKGEIASGKSEAFTDFETIDPYFLYHAEKAVDYGMMAGFTDGTFQPKKALTRGEFVLILHKLLQNEHLLQRK